MKKHIKIFSLIIILIIADQLTKLWALADLRGSEGIPVISGVFELQYLENRGAAFGIQADLIFADHSGSGSIVNIYLHKNTRREKIYTIKNLLCITDGRCIW